MFEPPRSAYLTRNILGIAIGLIGLAGFGLGLWTVAQVPFDMVLVLERFTSTGQSRPVAVGLWALAVSPLVLFILAHYTLKSEKFLSESAKVRRLNAVYVVFIGALFSVFQIYLISAVFSAASEVQSAM